MRTTELGHAVLFVEQLDRSVGFYRDLLGFPLISKSDRYAAFSGGRTHHELLLIEVGKAPRANQGRRIGLYHLAFKIGDTDEELKSAIQELDAAGVEVEGASDHGVSHSLYISDPDGNTIELYVDVPGIDWKTNPDLGMVTRPLRLD